VNRLRRIETIFNSHHYLVAINYHSINRQQTDWKSMLSVSYADSYVHDKQIGNIMLGNRPSSIWLVHAGPGLYQSLPTARPSGQVSFFIERLSHTLFWYTGMSCQFRYLSFSIIILSTQFAKHPQQYAIDQGRGAGSLYSIHGTQQHHTTTSPLVSNTW
jgi:hypothetical protein